MTLARLSEVERTMILVFASAVTRCRQAFALWATLTLPSELQCIGSVRGWSNFPLQRGDSDNHYWFSHSEDSISPLTILG